jgi:hypothetical protein
VGIFDDGNKCRIILYRDQTMGQIPSRIMLRLNTQITAQIKTNAGS